MSTSMNILQGKLKFVTNQLALLNIFILSVHLPRKSLLTIFMSFVQPHLDYRDIIYDNPGNESLINKLEKVQYQACLAITAAIQGASHESLYKELILESLQSRQWYRKMIFFYKILNGLTPEYLFDIIPVSNDSCYNTKAQSQNLLNFMPEQKASVISKIQFLMYIIPRY